MTSVEEDILAGVPYSEAVGHVHDPHCVTDCPVKQAARDGRHLHRMVPDGPTRFVGGRRQVHQVCECGEEGWR